MMKLVYVRGMKKRRGEGRERDRERERESYGTVLLV